MDTISRQDIEGMNYRALQQACRQQQVNAAGKTAALRKRLLATLEAVAPSPVKTAPSPVKAAPASPAVGDFNALASPAASPMQKKAPPTLLQKVIESPKKFVRSTIPASEDIGDDMAIQFAQLQMSTTTESAIHDGASTLLAAADSVPAALSASTRNCKCGSSTHARTSSRACPLNKNKKNEGAPAAGFDTAALHLVQHWGMAYDFSRDTADAVCTLCGDCAADGALFGHPASAQYGTCWHCMAQNCEECQLAMEGGASWQ